MLIDHVAVRAAESPVAKGQELFGLYGKVAVVTGGGRGLGAATVRRFARAGANVAVLDIVPERARTVTDRLLLEGGSGISVTCDVTDEPAVERALARVVGELGGLDILVNCAGHAVHEPATEGSLQNWRSVVDVNLTGPFVCARVAARYMRSRSKSGAPRGGVVVNVASVMGLSGGLFPNASFQASQGGVVNLTRALALEWARDGIRVNAVAPTFVRTDFSSPELSGGELLEQVMAQTPLGRLPETEDIAAAIQFLASPAAHCVTGIVLPVDAGFLAR